MSNLNGSVTQRSSVRVPAHVPAPEQVIDLAKGKIWNISAARTGQTVSCLEGEVWLTQENDCKDYFLTAGETMMITKSGQVIVQALRDSAVAGAARPADRPSLQSNRTAIH